MSIYDDEGALRAEELGRKIEFDTGMAWNVHDGVLVLKETGSSTSPVICEIRDTAYQFQVAIHGGGDTRYAVAYRSILGYVIHLRDLAEAAGETGNGPKVKPITEAEMATMDPPFPPEEPAPADVRDVLIARFDRIHELEEEFGDLLDQIQRSPTCSIGSIGSHYNAQLRVEDIARLRTLISKPDPEADVPKEPAPAEPTLREFLVEFRKWLVGGIPSDLRDWLDARLGKEESDG